MTCLSTPCNPIWTPSTMMCYTMTTLPCDDNHNKQFSKNKYWSLSFMYGWSPPPLFEGLYFMRLDDVCVFLVFLCAMDG